MGADGIERGQPLLADGADDDALADAIAAADLVLVVHGGQRRRGVGAGGGHRDILAEDDGVAQIAERLGGAKKIEIPVAVARIAVEHGADEHVVAHDEAAVDAARRVAEDDLLGPLPAREIAGGEHVDAGDLEAGPGDAALVGALGDAGERVGTDFRHVPDRGDQAVGLATVVDAFADGEDAAIRRAHLVVDDDAALGGEVHGLAEFDVRLDPHGHHDELGRKDRAVGEFNGLDALLCAVQRLGVGLGDNLDAALLEIGAQHRPGGHIELSLHQRLHQMQHGHVHAVALQPIGGLEAEQTAADDDRFAAAGGRRLHRLDVGDVAEADDARQVAADDGEDERVGAGGEQQEVVGPGRAVFAVNDLLGAVDAPDALAGDQLDAVLLVPGAVVDDDVVEILFAGEHRAEHDAVVVAVRLGAEDGDAEAVRRALEDLLDGAHPGHPVADDDETQTLRGNHVHGGSAPTGSGAGVTGHRWSAGR